MAYLDYTRMNTGVDNTQSLIPAIESDDIDVNSLQYQDDYMFVRGSGRLAGWEFSIWGDNFVNDPNRLVITDMDVVTPQGTSYLRDANFEQANVPNATDATAVVQELLKGDDEISGSNYGDRLVGGKKRDSIVSYGGDDFVHGQHGRDYIDTGSGNDTIRGGHGHDVLVAGSGADWIWGGQCRNTVSAGGNDFARDDIFVRVDSVLNPNGNPNGDNADVLVELGIEDRIFMHCVDDASLSFVQTNRSGTNGLGIYANGSLEAIVLGDFSAEQVDAMTQGGFFA